MFSYVVAKCKLLISPNGAWFLSGTIPSPPLYLSWAREGAHSGNPMNRLMISAAAIAVCLGSSAALAQDDTKTTTTVSSPDGMTQSTTTKTSDGYKQYTRTTTATKHYNAGVYVGPS